MNALILSRYVISVSLVIESLSGCGETRPPLMMSSPATQATSSQTRAGSYTILHSFENEPDGALPLAALTVLNGRLFGTTVRGGFSIGTVYKLTTVGAESVLHRFDGPPGAIEPEANLIAIDGTLYGTGFAGGRSYEGGVFAITPSGGERTIYEFGKPPDVSSPTAGLVELNGKMYGTAESGGTKQYYGGVFEVSTSGNERVLHRFTGAPNDGAGAESNLIVDDGLLYGVTVGGGSHNEGAIFSITKSGTERVLYSFKGGAKDGASPNALTLLNGTLYGTTMEGGSNVCEQGCGTIFSFKIGGSERVIHEFSLNEGVKPSAGLVAYRGELYGTTCAGGSYGDGLSCSIGSGFREFGVGSVFRFSPHGTFTVLHLFGGLGDGGTPVAPLIAFNGELYGTTENGGADFSGTVFRISP